MNEKELREQWEEFNGEMEYAYPHEADTIADYWLTQLRQSHIALLEQMIVENNKRRQIPPIGFPDRNPIDNSTEKCERWTRFGHNTVIEQINTDLRERIAKLKA